jgi:transcription initiation factor TFIIIB Brf1 subunit/transcription initiation factor TFIIB
MPATIKIPRLCECCGVSEEVEMLALSGAQLVCSACDAVLEREWVAEDPDNRRHYLDTFSPGDW